MSIYKDFVRDFPARCLELLRRSERMNSDLEVTQLLMVASTALVIPRERLKDRNNTLEPGHKPKRRKGGEMIANHPDVAEFLELAKSIHQELKTPIRHGSFWELIQSSVQYQKLRRPGGIELSAVGPVATTMTTEQFFNILRNAVAHGNIFVTGGKSREIATLTFGQSVERGSDEYEFITLSVHDFRQVLLGWVGLLLNEDLTTGVMPTPEESAA